jgi:hypothetical protein
MRMSRRERRELRHMAEAIRADDPLLAAMLGAGTWSDPGMAPRNAAAARNSMAASDAAGSDDGARRPPARSPWSPGAWAPGAWAPGSGSYAPLSLF